MEPLEIEVVRSESVPRREGSWMHPVLVAVTFGPGVAIGLGMLVLMLLVLSGVVRG